MSRFEMRRTLALLALLALTALATAPLCAQKDAQQPRAATKDGEGLLKINRQFYELAAATGGDFYFWAPGEFASVAPVDIPEGGEDVLLAYGALGGSKTEFAIPVETGVRRLTIFCGIQRKDLAVILRPDDSPVRHGDPGVKLQTFQHMTVATVDMPVPGVWTLELTGYGFYSVSAAVRPGSDSPSLDSFEFVERGGRPGHEGLFPIKRAPKRGESLTARAGLSGRVTGVEFSFVAGDGSPLGPCRLAMRDGDWLGTCTIPKHPFRVMVKGIDGEGQRFRRIEPAVVAPE